MAEFFAYEHIKELVVYWAFGMFAALIVWSYGYWIVSGVKWIVKKLKKRFGKETTTEEENANE